ncbi:unnamed protein product, partial [Callosobruchus maculatus]
GRPGFSGNSRVGQILWARPPELPVVSRHAVENMSSSSDDDFVALESVFTKLKRKKLVHIRLIAKEQNMENIIIYSKVLGMIIKDFFNIPE